MDENKEKLGKVLGSTLNEGNQMSQAVLVASWKVSPHRTLCKLMVTEQVSETEKWETSIFNNLILEKLGDLVHKPEVPISDYVPYSNNDMEDPIKLPNDKDPVDENGKN
eukprot:3512959-Ditylum_brightwellii.AAC.1